jgi:hypothetical protein
MHRWGKIESYVEGVTRLHQHTFILNNDISDIRSILNYGSEIQL